MLPNQDRGILGIASFEYRRSRRNSYTWWKMLMEWHNRDILVRYSQTDLIFVFSEETGEI
ncbi:MAG: hypothetical protein JGK24_23530 [Microcoleus sp. PH2017_29_MFU_D_A]|uniref:hypothetical protein n=1 Tax=unclassified Microcoleus TaxID=2642155 RepID=UPI001D2DBA15|nr:MULTISPECIES: hypothetical protein [unclassified Microcoleus]MCC3418032.1 hypothetical protein [Microcoleus sp. PH2017_07_MST_O_A]MCC3422517.1 hypothetical protein [Microcoleus sp. PH2017_01_SCD_O_A]MCC3490950.1 hypothetical protein [Microcoleus sp. PH2017_16_JOR_D_A]MCC3534660.1 hypothetical protein [Microcoleus sp. PH2017_25_DOB_D_A]MCC3434625.1 hypothetical protein [Microcoleus sp. PH2017_05_CCC_O_A]